MRRLSLWIIGVAVFLASAASLFALIYLAWEPVDPRHLVPGAIPMAITLFLIAAGAGLARRGVAGWTASVAGASAALGFYGIARNATTTIQGATVVMSRTDFTYAAAAFACAALIVVSLGYWAGSTLAALIGGHAEPGPTRQGRRLTIATLVVIPIVSVVFGAWLSTTSLVLDVGATDAAVHRLTISETSLQLDATSIPSGEVIFLATVNGHPPFGLSLVDVSRSGERGFDIPPVGSADYLLARMELLPGPWEFRLDGMTAKFEVTP